MLLQFEIFLNVAPASHISEISLVPTDLPPHGVHSGLTTSIWSPNAPTDFPPILTQGLCLPGLPFPVPLSSSWSSGLAIATKPLLTRLHLFIPSIQTSNCLLSAIPPLAKATTLLPALPVWYLAHALCVPPPSAGGYLRSLALVSVW